MWLLSGGIAGSEMTVSGLSTAVTLRKHSNCFPPLVDADPPHLFSRLRPRLERPCDRDPTKECEELASIYFRK